MQFRFELKNPLLTAHAMAGASVFHLYEGGVEWESAIEYAVTVHDLPSVACECFDFVSSKCVPKSLNQME